MFLISPLDGFEIQTEPYGRTWLTRTISWDSSLNPKLVLHKKYSGPCELRLNLLGLRAVVGSHGSGWSQKKEIIKNKKKRDGAVDVCHFKLLSFFKNFKNRVIPKFQTLEAHFIFQDWRVFASLIKGIDFVGKVFAFFA